MGPQGTSSPEMQRDFSHAEGSDRGEIVSNNDCLLGLIVDDTKQQEAIEAIKEPHLINSVVRKRQDLTLKIAEIEIHFLKQVSPASFSVSSAKSAL